MEKFIQLKIKPERRYYLVKCKSDSYTLQFSHNIIKYVINSGELVFDTVYLNPLDNSKKSYNTCDNENQGIFFSG